MEYDSPYKSDSPFSYEVEEGELSCESGRSSPGTIRDCASDCGTQTETNMIKEEEKIKTFRVELENETQIVQTPQEIARKIQNKFGHRRNLQSFDTGNNNINNISEQGTNIAAHSYQNTRPRQNHNYNSSDTYMSPPLPNYPPPVRPPPPSDNYIIDQSHTQNNVRQRLFARTTIPTTNTLRFPYAVTPRSNNRKSFFHQSTNEQTPTETVMETIWFQNKDPKNLSNPHGMNYNPLLSYRNWTDMPFDSRSYNFFMAPLHTLKDRVSEFFPPLPSENTNTVKRSTKNMGRDKIHQSKYPKLKQFYSLTERFLYDYDYEFRLPVNCNFDLLVAKASQDLSAYSAFTQQHQIFQLSFNFLHPTPKDVQSNNYRVHETKLIQNLIYYTFLRDKQHTESKSYVHINDQLTSPYFLNYSYKLKWDYTIGTLRNFDPIKNYYVFQPKDAPERPLMVPLEAIEPCEEYHVYHLTGSVTNKAITNRINFNNERKIPDTEREICNALQASITETPLKEIVYLLGYYLSKDEYFLKEYNHYCERSNHPKQTEKL